SLSRGGAVWDLATGAQRWAPEPNSENCADRGYGGGKALVAIRGCGDYSSPQLTVQPLNPVTGKAVSSYALPRGVQYAHIVSTDPLVVAAEVGSGAGAGSGVSDYFSIDAKTGKLRSRIAADANKYGGKCDSTNVEGCRYMVVGNDRLYLPTEEHDGGGDTGRVNEILSFDLATGKQTSDKADSGTRYAIYPLRMDGGNLVAYKRPPYDKGGQVVSIDGGTFKQTVLLENPSDKSVRDVETSFSLDGAELRFQNGRLYIADTILSAESSYSGDEKRYLVAGFTTG
ncbi:hypothetical protein J0695_19245, partial [Streptomyces beijiangensis]|nr:hypothetical protein [Streptomyces beijiangensis]